ncbi:MAG: translational GTPase TypA [Myxococcota bacterium]|nr:translational GTPase TypA [Myxococcota bacterium]
MGIDLRNIAIIAHVDHGKTTLVDHMLQQAGTFRENEEIVDRVMDSMDLERERGITILAKNTAIWYGGTKINIVDTPGHADFGAEVERVLKMVDAALLLVDASEGPLPQTRFVLEKALQSGLKVLVCINKIDRPDARAEEVYNEIFDLFIDLDANDDQADFSLLYACAKEGYAHHENKCEPGDLRPLFDLIINEVPPPKFRSEEIPQFLVTQLGHDKYLGRLSIGRLFNGTLSRGQDLLLVGEARNRRVKISQLFTYEGLKRIPTETVEAGDIAAIAGIEDLNIGDTLTDKENPKPLPRVNIDEPTIGVLFLPNNGPLSGKEGKFVTGRQIHDRLMKEALHNVSIRIEEADRSDAIRLFGRGELQLAILLEQMRREGFEMLVSKPEVKLKKEGERTLEPYELATLDFPQEFMGVVSEKLNHRKGEMADMKLNDSGRFRLVYRVPSRGLIGFRGEYLNDTRGQGVISTLFDGWDDYAGDFLLRLNGSMVADRFGSSTAYALFTLQQRGKLFIGTGTEVYEGMVVGECSKQNDLNINVCKAKQLTNIRSAGADTKLILAPPVKLSLEKALEFIAEDELVEVTPKSIRLRKKELRANMRSVVRGAKKS